MAKTWRFTTTDSAFDITGQVFGHQMAETGSGTQALLAPNGSGTATGYWISPSGDNLAGQSNTGSWTVVLNVSIAAGNTDVTVSLRRYNSGGTQQSSVTMATANTSTGTTGDKTFTVTSPALGTWASGDRLVVAVQVRNTNAHGGDAGPTFDLAATNTRIDSPFTLANNYTSTPSGSLSFTGAIAKSAGKVLTGSLSFTGATVKSVSRSLTGSLGLDGLVSKRTGRSVGADVSFSTAFAADLQPQAVPALVIVHTHTE